MIFPLATAYPRRWLRRRIDSNKRDLDYSSLQSLIVRKAASTVHRTGNKYEPVVRRILSVIPINQVFTSKELSEKLNGELTPYAVTNVLWHMRERGYPVRLISKTSTGNKYVYDS